jgi:hypothetical protein
MFYLLQKRRSEEAFFSKWAGGEQEETFVKWTGVKVLKVRILLCQLQCKNKILLFAINTYSR